MAQRLRCAIYTRKSSEEGLDQSFNSLHAQREACEAYIRSQEGEGWKALKTLYDDGGFSGGSMQRPALQALLADVDEGLIDTIVVYKVDRLTRSLTDFAKIVEALERRDVSFVSVTQAFNTTTSMGRLTLNVLLSFAQFEREVTGERIRDKIAASKAKGIWMGGPIPLGYDAKDRELVINEQEAAVVRLIFDRYLALGSARAVVTELDAGDIRTKRWITRRGKEMGGSRFGRGGVFHILQNRLYVGEITHKAVAFPGKHSPIVDREKFDLAAKRLAENAVEHRNRPIRAGKALLIGKVIDPNGEPMTPTTAYGRRGRLYRYYATRDGNGAKPSPDEIRRVSAPALEGLLRGEAERLLGRSLSNEAAAEIVERVELRLSDTLVTISLDRAAPGAHPGLMLRDIRSRLADGEEIFEGADAVTVLLPRRMKLRGGRSFIVNHAGECAGRRTVTALRAALKRAHRVAADHHMQPGRMGNWDARSPSSQYLREIVTLAFLAPSLQRRVLTDAIPGHVTLQSLSKRRLPLAWADQADLFEGRSGGGNLA